MLKQNRNDLKNSLAEALNNDIQTLSTEMKDILLDDLVTAYENRLKVLERAQSNLQPLINVEVNVEVAQ